MTWQILSGSSSFWRLLTLLATSLQSISAVTLSFLILVFLPSYEAPCHYIELICIIQDHPPIGQSFLITSTNSHLPCKFSYSQALYPRERRVVRTLLKRKAEMLSRLNGFQGCNYLRVSLEQSIFYRTTSRPREIPHCSNLFLFLKNTNFSHKGLC